MSDSLRLLLSRIPAGVFSGLTVAAILWLTLAPKPLGENPPPLFPGADKIAHAVMFGGFTLTLALDWQRKHRWNPVTPERVLIYAISSAFLGIVIEFLQAAMGLGRGFEIADMIADIIGAFFFGLLYLFSQKLWTISPK